MNTHYPVWTRPSPSHRAAARQEPPGAGWRWWAFFGTGVAVLWSSLPW